MVLFKRKQVQYTSPPILPDDAEIWVIEETGELFAHYEDYLKRNDFYRQRRFICEITGHSGLTFREALRSEKEASGEIDDSFPEPLREPILRKVQFQQVARIDYIVDWIYEEFRRDFYPGENVIVAIGEDRYTGRIKEKAKFPELARADGTIERKAFARYFCRVNDHPDGVTLMDEEHIARERKVFTKQRIKSYLKNSIAREAWTGAPWLVKPRIAEEYHIPTEIPHHLTQEYQIKQRRVSSAGGKKNIPEGHFLNFQAYGPQGGSQVVPLKPRGKKSAAHDSDSQLHASQFMSYHHSNSNLPFHIANGIHNAPQSGAAPNGFHPIAAKGRPKVSAPPPPPKGPIEDLEVPPKRDGTHRPALKFLDQTHNSRSSSGVSEDMTMESVGSLLETWNTLNVYCQVFTLDSFTFDDYLDALAENSDSFLQCELLVEVHCAVLKKLVNDVNDKNGQVQIQLPDQLEDETSSQSSSSEVGSPSPEPEVSKPPARSTRSSLLRSEAVELQQATNSLSLADTKTHQASEMDQQVRGADWKARLRKREFEHGGWITIIVGLLNQLSLNPRYTTICNDILEMLAPLDKSPTLDTARDHYQSLDINRRASILQIMCTKCLETKAIRDYMEECSVQMTQHRKERNEKRKEWKAAIDELRQLNEQRKELQPENPPDTPAAEESEIQDPGDEEDDQIEEDSGSAQGSEEDEPHQGRSLRRANDRAQERKKRAAEERQRKLAVAAERAKKPTKEERQYEKVLKQIEAAKETIKDWEEELAVVENDLREADCPRTRGLGKDRFWNRYYWMERNAMPFAGLPDSSTANAGYANGCVWVQGPDDIERTGFIELSDEENAQYARAFQLTVPQRKELEEGETHVFNARQWGYYDDPECIDMLIGWLDDRGTREAKLRKEISNHREKIVLHMGKRQEYLSKDNDDNSETNEPTTRVSTRTKTYVDSSNHRHFKWRNTTALDALGHIHSQPKPPTRKQRGVAIKKSMAPPVEEDFGPRQMRKTTKAGSKAKGSQVTSGGRVSRQGARYGS